MFAREILKLNMKNVADQQSEQKESSKISRVFWPAITSTLYWY